MAFVSIMGDDAEEALTCFKIIHECVKKVPGTVFGTASSVRIEKMIQKAGTQAGLAGSRPLEGAARLMVLLIKKNYFTYCKKVITDIEKLLDAGKKIIPVTLEYVHSPGIEFENQISEIIRKRTGAKEIRLDKKAEPSLIGGCRLKIGDKVIDASVISQLRNLEAVLAFDQSGIPANGAE